MAKLTILNPAGGGTGGGAPGPSSAPLMPRPETGLVPLRPAPMLAPMVAPPPAPPAAGGGSGFGGPIPVILVAPVPLDVRIVGGMPAPAAAPPPAPKEKAGEGWGKWMLDLAGTGVRRAGVAAAGVAGGSAMPALNTAVDGAVAGLSKLGPYGMAAAAGVKVFSETIGAVKETINGLVQRGRELAPYSGTLAASAARADVRKIQADIGEAERIGPQLAKLIEAQSKAEAMQQRMLEQIKLVMSEKLVALLEKGTETMIGILEGVNTLPGINGNLTKLINELKAIGADSGDTTALVEKWARGFGGPMTPVAPPARPGPMGMPLF